MEELAKTYDPKNTERRIYNLWEKSGAFSPDIKADKKPYVICIPPPNVTGSLHMGHALNNTIQDILIRRARMQGVPTLWIPGTDHAGIATQNVVEKQLAKKNINKNDLSREEFIAEIQKWVAEYGHTIIDQLKQLGCSCDWSRQRYTMDKDYAEAVNVAFQHYFDKGLIYQGERVINWCVRCQTALSDIELEHQEVEGKLWFIKYMLLNPKSEARNPKQIQNSKSQIQNYITVATTRPETMLGDTAVAVHPDDKRYKDLIGQKVKLPLVGREIPIIADAAVDPKFGTGAVKVTPAHDPNDFEIGTRHNLEKIKVINETGKITQIKPTRFDYMGQKTLEARENILNDLEKQGLIEKIQDYTHQVPHCYRCGRPVEQLISEQWFLKMKDLIKPAIEAIETNQIKLTPTRWKKVYLDWMENIHDWCISRQIVWGHKIPIDGVDDVLDTWFSSALWPFATLGWPKKTADLKAFYPTTLIVTARDINMLWVVRMIFSGFEFMDKKPFSQVYINPTVFNKEGKRMSKSLGTGVDPIDLINKYGADATRFGLMYINTGTQDIKFDEAAILAGQKFANKLWNISRFVLLQIGNSKFEARNSKQIPNPKTENDKKILKRLEEIIKSTDANLDKFAFGQAAHDLYDFIWHDFADIYIEESKNQMDANTQAILNYALKNSLILLHPFMPFVTEEIWQKLKEQNLVEEELLINGLWPKPISN